MEFLNPWGWLGLLALPTIVALHFFRRRYQTLKSATVMFWRQLRERDAAGRTPRPIRSSLSLWLQLLAASLLTFMLAGPQTRTSLADKELIIVLDSSYSLQARRNDHQTVADAIRGEILRRLNAHRPGDAHTLCTVIEHGASPRLLTARHATLAEARAAIAHWTPAQPRADWPATLQLLQLWELDKCIVWVFTDRLTDEWKHLPGVELVSLGALLDNLAFGEASRTRLPDSGKERIRALVHNFSNREQATEVRRGNDQWPVIVPANGTRQFEADVPASNAPIELQLPGDDLPFDNRVVLCPLEDRPISVAFDFHAEGLRTPWERALRAVTAFNVAVLASNQPVTATLILSDDERWLRADDVAACVIVCAANVADPKLYRAPFLAEPNHPLLRGLDWSGCLLAIGGWPGTSFAPQLPRVSARDRIVLGEVPSRNARKFILHADITRGNLTRQPAFPVLAQNAVEIARSFEPGLRTPNLRFGERVEFRPPRDAEEICVAQDGWRECFARADNVRIPPDRVGLFEVSVAGMKPSRLAINHNDPRTSDLRSLAAGGYKTRATPTVASRTLHDEWLMGMTLALVAILFIDWRVARRGALAS